MIGLTKRQRWIIKRAWLAHYQPDFERFPSLDLHLCINARATRGA